MMDLRVNLLGYTLDNPVIPASGTFGFGYEFAEFYDINCLGSISLKGTTLEPRYGNPLPRIAECPSGLLNSIGLQNPGAQKVVTEELAKLGRVYGKKVIANVGGSAIDDYVQTASEFNNADSVFAIELNISCPNVKHGGMAFGTDPKVAAELVREVKKASTKPVMVKLSPNVTDITELAKAVEGAGADAVSLINTLVGMRIDLRTAKPILSAVSGGYSGPGVFPVALRMVYQVKKAVGIPVVGMGGIMTAYDVIEMMYAGAAAVMVGTANLVNPYACRDIIASLPRVMEELNISSLKEIIGRAHNG
ncbi:MAG: dihydroorotate dehydrogenase [Clostridiales bacterium]|nr:dihydroorotate dehydrogenase [Clostridiales bacterium]HOL61374.1 dihydroorotate dehydrogenase [Clostridia bacterium]